MTVPAKSYKQVHYEFRLAKQVERRMLVDFFQKLMEAGFPIADYQYTGMGSIYFIDFILFHRYLGIHRLTSVECCHEVEKRVKFNKPFATIDVEMEDILDYIPRLSLDRQHFLWLDYDHVLTEGMINAVVLACSQLSPGSILLVTVDVEPPGSPTDGPLEWQEHFVQEAGQYLWPEAQPRDFARARLPEVNARLLKKAVAHGLAGRRDVRFCPLFKFLYADGHRMLSLGGMIGRATDRRKLESLNRSQLPFLRDDLLADAYEIRVPLVTRKEKLYLDSAMPCDDAWQPEAFELSQDDVRDYCRIYRYYTSYAETLL